MKRILTVLFLLIGSTILHTTVSAYDCSQKHDMDNSLISGIPIDQCEGLLRLYNELDGPNWTDNTNWLVDGTDTEDWYGIENSGGQIYRIRLGGNNLTGEISSRSGLNNTQEISLQENNITGIPSEWNNNGTEIIYLYDNDISEIPPQRTNLNNVEEINIGRNPITKIPESRNGLNNVIYIYISETNISGLPSSRSGLERLKYIHLDTNNIEKIPSSRSGLTNIKELYLRNNEISQTFPTNKISLLSGIKIEIYNNNFYGDIPSSFTTINGEEIHNNYFNTGNISSELSNRLDEKFSYSKTPYYWTEQNKAMTMFSSALGYFNKIKNITVAIHKDIEIDCTTATKINATNIAGGYDNIIVDKFCGSATTGTKEINLVKFK